MAALTRDSTRSQWPPCVETMRAERSPAFCFFLVASFGMPNQANPCSIRSRRRAQWPKVPRRTGTDITCKQASCITHCSPRSSLPQSKLSVAGAPRTSSPTAARAPHHAPTRQNDKMRLSARACFCELSGSAAARRSPSLLPDRLGGAPTLSQRFGEFDGVDQNDGRRLGIGGHAMFVAASGAVPRIRVGGPLQLSVHPRGCPRRVCRASSC